MSGGLLMYMQPAAADSMSKRASVEVRERIFGGGKLMDYNPVKTDSSRCLSRSSDYKTLAPLVILLDPTAFAARRTKISRSG